jgi:hypothetical protein
MGPQPMGKVPDLGRLAGRVAPRSTVHWSWLWTFLGLCLLAAVVGGPAGDLPHARVAAAVAEIPRSVRGPAGLWQTITFGQPPDTTAGQQVTWTASSVTTTSPPVGTGLGVPVRSGTPALGAVSGSIATPAAPGCCVITSAEGGTVDIGAEGRAVDGVPWAGWEEAPGLHHPLITASPVSLRGDRNDC